MSTTWHSNKGPPGQARFDTGADRVERITNPHRESRAMKYLGQDSRATARRPFCWCALEDEVFCHTSSYLSYRGGGAVRTQ